MVDNVLSENIKASGNVLVFKLHLSSMVRNNNAKVDVMRINYTRENDSHAIARVTSYRKGKNQKHLVRTHVDQGMKWIVEVQSPCFGSPNTPDTT
jgi:hypothetical protein